MSARLHAALEFAVRAHAGQDREGHAPPPYVCHPVEVMLSLRYTGGVTDEDLLVVALLHDTLEATPATTSEVSVAFGPRVGALVQELTRAEPADDETAGMKKDEIWRLRAGMLLAEVERMSPDAQAVKLADRLSNVREARIAKSPEKFERYLGQTRRMLDLIPRKRNPGLWDAVAAEVEKGRGA
ncbi:MAG: HD domain-containing protein [Fimbriimonadaceae bacterium]